VLTVLVVDDQAPFRFAVKAVLRRLPCFQLAGEAKSGPEAITLVDEVHPALVLMDINMPEMNGIEATRRIVAAHPDVVVFLCSTHDITDLPPGAPTSGARAYINKEHFGADALRQLWHNRDSTPFARLLPPPGPASRRASRARAPPSSRASGPPPRRASPARAPPSGRASPSPSASHAPLQSSPNDVNATLVSL